MHKQSQFDNWVSENKPNLPLLNLQIKSAVASLTKALSKHFVIYICFSIGHNNLLSIIS